MLVSEWMTRDPVTLSPDAPLSRAAGLMAKRRVRRVPVVDGAGRLVGIVTKSDLLAACPPTVNPFSAGALVGDDLPGTVETVMARSPVTVRGESPIELAAHLMLRHRIGGLPVLVGGALAGIVTESDIFRAFSAALGAREAGVRITFDLSRGEDPAPFVVDLARRHRMRVGSIATYERDGRRSAVIRLVGEEPPHLIDEIWETHHRVTNVVRLAAE
jgi:acetoin utilization protein AcuB